MRLIDADAILINGIKNKTIEIRYEDLPGDLEMIFTLLFKDVRAFIDEQPTIDAVPVVRCAECKYLDESLAMGGWDGSCRYWNTHSTVYSGFCSFGEKVTE